MVNYTYWNKWSTPFLEVKNENHNTEKLMEETDLWGNNSILVDDRFLTDRESVGHVPGQMIKNYLYESSFSFFEEVEEKKCSELLKLKKWIEYAFVDVFFDFFTLGSYAGSGFKNEFEEKNISKNDIKIDLKESWLHITANSGMHGAHNHRGFSWALIYYISSGDSSATNGHNIFYNYGQQAYDYNLKDFGNFYRHKDDCMITEPEDGKMIMFPAEVVHAAQVYKTDSKSRIVVACNVRLYCDKW